MKTLKKTYLIAIAASLIPAWIGSALLSYSNDDNLGFDSPSAIAALLFFALALFGTSLLFSIWVNSNTGSFQDLES